MLPQAKTALYVAIRWRKTRTDSVLLI